MTVESGVESTVDARLVRAAVLSGEVTAAFRPTDEMILERRTTVGWEQVRHVGGGRDGRFRFGDLLPGAYRIVVLDGVTALSYGPTTSREGRVAVIRLKAGDRVRGFRVWVPPPAQMTGTVRNSAGRPLANHSVGFETSGTVHFKYLYPGRQVRARTDAEGRYRVLLPPDNWMLWQYKGCAFSVGPWVAVVPGRRYARDFTHDPPASIAGRLTRPNGRPLVDTAVRSMPVEGTSGCSVSSSTGPDGRWELRGLQPGSHRISYGQTLDGGPRFHHPAWRRPGRSAPIEVAPGESVTGLKAVLGARKHE